MSYTLGDTPTTWYLLPDGRIDEIQVADYMITTAMELARSLGATYFWRRGQEHVHDMSWDWLAYVMVPGSARVWNSGHIRPFKIVRSPDMSAVEMLCRAKAAMQ